MDIGYAFDEDGIPEDEPTSIPENKLTNHWLKVGSSGSGKTINTIGMILSLYDNVDGPVLLVDPKSGDMVENYAKSHAARFGDLRDVKIFEVPDVLPAIPFFDIRPHLHEGMKRDDAIQQKVDEFDMIMHMIDDNYGNAYVAKSVLGALIKSQFDARHGADSFTLDELYDAAVEMYTDQTISRVSHQPQVKRILSNQLTNTEQDFKNTMQAVINRLDDLQEDINLYRLFNQNPEWDDNDGEYRYNRMTEERHKRAKENEHVTDPEPPRTALDFRELLDTDDVVLFDTGNFVRDESQQAFSMYILSALWSAVKSRYNDRKSHEEIDNTANLIIEESAPIVSTELVTNTLIPEGREFGLSLGMVMQYPEQVLGENPRANKRAYKEILNNVNTKIIGNIATDDLLADALFHEDLDTDEIKDRISGLKRGEWVVQLPATGFDERKPEILTLKPIPIPPGHSEGPVTVRSQQESVRKRSRDLHCLSNDHELINVEQSIGSANTDDDDDPDPDGASIDGDITAPEHGFLDTVYRALNGQFDDINYDITDSMTEIKDHGDVVESLQEKNLLTTIDAGDDDGNGEDAPERELEGSNAETIRVGETRNKYYRPHDDAGPLVGRSFNDKIGENGEESLSHRLGVLLVGKYYQEQGYDVSFYEDDDFSGAVFDVSVEATEESPSDMGRVVEVETTPEKKSHVAGDYTHLASSVKESVWVVEDRDSAYRLIRSVQEKLDSSPNKHDSVEEINNQVDASGLSKIFTLNGLLDELD